MQVDNLLIELGTEELPPKSLKALAQAFADGLSSQLEQAELKFSSVVWYASPRRLAVYVKELAAQQQDKSVEKRGPAVAAAFDAEGNPTKAALGWAKSNGIEVAQAERLKTDKGEWLMHVAHVEGQPLQALMAGLVEQALKTLPIPKPMRWGNSDTSFIRPVHTLTMLYGNQVVDGKVLGLDAGNTLQGHRFHGAKQFALDHADDYLQALEKHFVVADFGQRKQRIADALQQVAAEEDAVLEADDDLLEEVTALVEWPVVLKARFDDEFLQVPKEALIYTMKDDQKYFPLLDQSGSLKSVFLFVTNIESKDPQQIVSGNEKVIRPRLSDARFFFETDKKQSLESRLDSLESVLFQKQLGSLKDKSLRIAKLSQNIAGRLNADTNNAYRAGLLSKTDLMTNMVMEFPDVQGVMGMHYAVHDGENADVANALDEQYKPRFAGDELPQGSVSRAVALADKLDTLVGIFGIGQTPKGDKDPFALRRAAIGVLRILVEGDLPLDLTDLVADSVAGFGDLLSVDDVQQQVVDFILGRFRTWYQDQGISVDVIQAVMARRPTQPSDFNARIHAVSQFKQHEAAEALAAANKRVANILAKQDDSYEGRDVNEALLTDPEETKLFELVSETEQRIAPLLVSRQYADILNVLAGLRESIDAFFDKVMVMADDADVRSNRLALVAKLRSQFLHCADISLLA